VIIGASFIGLEVASSLRARNIDVHVVGPEAIPMEKILGPEVGNFIRRLHEDHGVAFHLGTTATSINKQSVTLQNEEVLQADLVVVGIGVRPDISLAERAGLATDRGVLAYVGHAERWDQAEIDGSLDKRDCAITYRRQGKKLAVAFVHRDLEGLRTEVEFESAICGNSSSIQAAQHLALPSGRTTPASGS
jgi:hypothetical protein